MLPQIQQMLPPNHPFMLTINDLLIPSYQRSNRTSFPQFTSHGNLPDNDYEQLLQLGELLQPVNRGASSDIIQSIPERKFKLGSIPKEEAKCGICLSDYEINESLKSLPKCLHHFHSDCIDKWLAINKICPVCREEIIH